MKGNSTHGQVVGLLRSKLPSLYHKCWEQQAVKPRTEVTLLWLQLRINLTTSKMQTLDSYMVECLTAAAINDGTALGTVTADWCDDASSPSLSIMYLLCHTTHKVSSAESVQQIVFLPAPLPTPMTFRWDFPFPMLRREQKNKQTKKRDTFWTPRKVKSEKSHLSPWHIFWLVTVNSALNLDMWDVPI